MPITITLPVLVLENSILKFNLMQPNVKLWNPTDPGIFFCTSLNLCIKMMIHAIYTCISITVS